MEKRTSKNKYSKQDKYFKKTYKQLGLQLRKEWNLYDTIKFVAQKKQCSINSLAIYYIVEGLKKDGYKPSLELKAFIDNNYKK